ncbi:hypothetical protein K443DRAFT_354028 [Laccaria amethystina LaAM-08-1]|uniref:Uncharacterized protein n=1 Tax=Laccaria amethystina LaAM-08-1 TaxID=1095629 RepID=A0A0C9XV32_9AGAR|nr:hypothetical protein K443DRAFT_354028 [Laccaria amethystina LaAM-08-1]
MPILCLKAGKGPTKTDDKLQASSGRLNSWWEFSPISDILRYFVVSSRHWHR